MGAQRGPVFEPLSPEDPREVAGHPLLARLGEGGMGAVYLSRTRGGRPVAIKVVRREYARDASFRRRFAQEVRAASRVRGYHLVAVVDHDSEAAAPWLASEYVAGVGLDQALDEHGPLPPDAVLKVTACVARALATIHAAGIVHRDLKPSNIMLAASGPFVIDFGIARAADATQLTTTGGLIGTPHYMSPEQALGDPVGAAGDMFALGLVAAVAATGRHPYGDGGAITVATQIANTAVRPPDLSGYPDALRPLLERCLTASPEERITPSEVEALCAGAAARPLDDFGGWLPGELARSLAQRAVEVDRLVRAPRPSSPAPLPPLPPPPVSALAATGRSTRPAPPEPPEPKEPPGRARWVWGGRGGRGGGRRPGAARARGGRPVVRRLGVGHGGERGGRVAGGSPAGRRGRGALRRPRTRARARARARALDIGARARAALRTPHGGPAVRDQGGALRPHLRRPRRGAGELRLERRRRRRAVHLGLLRRLVPGDHGRDLGGHLPRGVPGRDAVQRHEPRDQLRRLRGHPAGRHPAVLHHHRGQPGPAGDHGADRLG
ncbi:serine/threonine protein kinase [Streptomyces radicis]|uniref:non-specific serine/threonine protein kinase n=1 Tax=Streptomyces radicis TaxID=1750517 RepID=A0A3A9WI15_9ACTN|nr:serine/threonine protein kinase [Streptomyces radicis]RKN26092.1 serine/threonine protein kinase [Streptomyces radicis]